MARCRDLNLDLNETGWKIASLFDEVGQPIDLDEVWRAASNLDVKINRWALYKVTGQLVKAGVIDEIGRADKRARYATPINMVVTLETAEAAEEIHDPSVKEALLALCLVQGEDPTGRRVVISVRGA